MAVSLTGTFSIIDRASGPMRRMEQQARRTDAAIQGIGSKLDQVGTNQHLRQLERTDRAMRNVDRSTQRSGVSMQRTSRHMRVLSRDTDGLGDKLMKVGSAIMGLSRVFGLLKIPALIAGFGALTQVVVALGAGVIALTPKIADLAGAGVGLGSSLVGIGLAAVTVKVAMKDVGQALGGNEQAMKRLTPRAREFVGTLADMRPVMKDLRTAAQAGLFPGLTRALRELQRGAPTAERLLGRMGRTVGRGASRAARSFTTPESLRDIDIIGRGASRTMDRLFRGMINLGHAAMDLVIAARPFTNWLERTILGWTRWARESARAGRNTGSLTRYFDRVRDSMETWFEILGNVWGTLRNIGRAARDTGDQMYDSITRTTQKWEDWTGSMRGQMSLRRWFADALPVIKETFGLFGDIAGALLRIGSGGEGLMLVRGLRRLVPVLEHVTRSVMRAFGPTLIDSITQFARAFETLIIPFGQFGRILNQLLRALNWMLDNVPGVTQLIGGLIAVMTFRKVFGSFDGLIGRWRTLRGEISATNAVASGGAVAVGGGRGGAAVVARRRGAAPLTARNVTQTRGGVPLTAFPIGMRGGVARQTAREGRAALGGRLLGGAGGLARGAGRFAAPAAAMFALSDAINFGTQGGGFSPGRAVQGAVHGATLGLFPAPMDISPETLQSEGGTAARQLARGASTARLRSLVSRTRREAMVEGVTGPIEEKAGRGLGAEGVKSGLVVLREELRLRKQINTEMALQRADKWTGSLIDAFNIFRSRRGPAFAMRRTIHDIGTDLARLGPVGRKQMGQNMLSWAREQERNNPRLKGFYERMRRQVRSTFRGMGNDVVIFNDRIFRNSDKAWASIKDAISTRAERARQEVTKNFTAIQQQAIGALADMGFSRSQARGLIGLEERGGQSRRVAREYIGMGPGGPSRAYSHANARGGRIAGQGLQDNVMVAPGQLAAPGELIVNRHTERRIDGLLNMAGTSLGGEVAGERRAHSAAYGARTVPSASLGHPELQPGISRIASAVLARFPGLSITSTTGGTHAAGSYHYKGEAVDLGGASGLMNQASAWLRRAVGRNLTEGIHNPNLSIKGGQAVSPSFWGGDVWAQHANHIHLAVAGLLGALGGIPGGAGGMGRVHLRTPRSAFGGLPGLLSNTATSLYGRGLQRRINRRLANMGGGNLAGFKGGGSNAANRSLGRRMAAAMGWTGPEWSALNQLWQGESGWSSTIANQSSGAYGIPQALPGSKMASAGGDWRTNPATQIAWGLQYIKGRYGSPSGALSQWQSRSPHWYGAGGDFIATRPQLIGVGDGGRERVTVSPAGGRGRGGGVRIGTLVVQNHRQGDVREQVVREVGQAFRDLHRLLDDGTVEHEEELT